MGDERRVSGAVIESTHSASASASASESASESAGFELRVAPHLAVMHRLAVTLASGSEPEDIVQEALVRAWQKRDTYRPERGTARAWLLALVRDRARRARTRNRTRFVLLDRPEAMREVLPEATVAALVPDVDLRAAIAGLAPRQRQVIVLFYYVDLSVEETARVLGCASGTVKSTLADARARLQTILGTIDD